MGEKYNYDVSKAYDTIFYMTVYFYEHDIFTRFRERFGDIEDFDEVVHPYYTFKAKHQDYVLPSEISPFVHTNKTAGLQSFLIHYLNNNLNPITGTKEDALDLIKNGELLKRQLFEHILPQTQLNTADSIADIVNELPYATYTSDIKVHIAFLISDFNKYHNILIDVYNTIYDFVDEWYSENQETIDEIKRLINDEDYNIIERLKTVFKIPNAVSSFSYHVSLLNGLLVNYRKKKNEVDFGLGLHFRAIVEMYRTGHISHKEMPSGDVFAEVLEMFTRNEDWVFSVTDIAHHLGYAKSVVYPHVNELHLKNIIRYSNSIETDVYKVYYRLNPDWFEVSRNVKIKIN